jgi:hypothetical protein
MGLFLKLEIRALRKKASRQKEEEDVERDRRGTWRSRGLLPTLHAGVVHLGGLIRSAESGLITRCRLLVLLV